MGRHPGRAAVAAEQTGYLRKYDTPSSDEPHFDLTPATERAIDFVRGLGPRAFVPTEARLLTVFELLRQIALGTALNRAAHVAELERRKSRLEAELARAREGEISPCSTTRRSKTAFSSSRTRRVRCCRTSARPSRAGRTAGG